MLNRTIAVVSQKGGVGKTTVSLNLALAFSERGRRTLLVDTDPQGGVGQSLARGDGDLAGLADVLMNRVTARDAVMRTKNPNLSLLPRGRLSAVDACDFEMALHAPGVLDGVLKGVGPYDVVVVDTPSGMGVVTRGVLRAVQWVLVPVKAEPLSLRGLGQVLEVLEHVAARENPQVRLLGILPTMVDKQSGPAMDVAVELWTGMDGILDTNIPRSETFAVASQQGLPVSYMGGTPTQEERRFTALAAELEALMDRQSQPGQVEDVRARRDLL